MLLSKTYKRGVTNLHKSFIRFQYNLHSKYVCCVCIYLYMYCVHAAVIKQLHNTIAQMRRGINGSTELSVIYELLCPNH